ncbi:MAG: hypothetical protein WBX78_01200, partial [Pseudolabrys sp.]
MFEQAARFANDGTELECDRFEMGVDPLTARRLYGTEQLIDPHVPYIFEHCYVAPVGPSCLGSYTQHLYAAHQQGAQSPPRQFNLLQLVRCGTQLRRHRSHGLPRSR